jgi:hypothetical protein
MYRINKFINYNILSSTDIDELFYTPYRQALGKVTHERIRQQLINYEYYHGKQHIDPNTGLLVHARDLPRPDGLDYDPTRYTTNLFKVFIQKKSQWQFGGKHSVHCKPKQVDAPEKQALPDYKPTPAQAKENNIANAKEELLRKLWKENKMQVKLLEASRDRLIGGQVACKIAFNPNTGKMHWIFRPDYEVIPVYSDDDFEDLIAVHFLHERMNNEDEITYFKQTYSLENGTCYLEEAIYDDALQVVETITPKSDMMIDFIPVVLIPVSQLSNRDESINQEVEDMKGLTDILNAMNEDAIDSLKFEMFSMTALINVPAGTVDKIQIAPATVLEVSSQGVENKGDAPSIQKVEGGFRWKDAFDDQYTRVKNGLHEITSVPNIVPQELNFGGLNNEALHVLFHSIIQETEEHWLVWQDKLQELHEKTLRYLQARTGAPAFAYDKALVKLIGDNYDSEIEFRLPLPDNRKDLVDLLTVETAGGFESIAGAMRRLGVEDVNTKQQEILNEKKANMELLDPYATGDTPAPKEKPATPKEPTPPKEGA